MSLSLITLLGLAAATLTTAANIPQVWRAWRRSETADLSLAMTTMLAAGLMLWVAYGIAQGDIIIIFANGIAFALAMMLTTLKMRYG